MIVQTLLYSRPGSVFVKFNDSFHADRSQATGLLNSQSHNRTAKMVAGDRLNRRERFWTRVVCAGRRPRLMDEPSTKFAGSKLERMFSMRPEG
jgi:hypothetical protein